MQLNTSVKKAVVYLSVRGITLFGQSRLPLISGEMSWITHEMTLNYINIILFFLFFLCAVFVSYYLYKYRYMFPLINLHMPGYR